MSRKRISNEQRSACFQCWCEVQTVNYVYEKSGIRVSTLKRFRREDKWDERLARVREEAQIIADARSGKRLARNLEILKFTKEKIVLGVKEDKIHGSVSDIPALIKTEELLVGNPDSRPEGTAIILDAEAARKEIERLAAALGITSENGSTPPSRISPAVVSSDPSPEHKE
jgi:hypothetical protein